MDESEITAEIAEAKRSGDAARLRAIAAGLDGRAERWVTLAKIKAIAAGRALEAAHATEQPTATSPPDRSLWLSRYGLPRPNGRPLHRYALSDAAFTRVEADLRARAARINADLSSDHDAALFVLWAAEWFRRNYAGGLQRWADVGRAVNVSLEQSSWRKLADRGLRYWRLPELRLNGMHRRLAAIARQGGFPVAAIGGAQGGWAANFLQKLIVQLLEHPAPTTAVAEELGRELEQAIPSLWRHDEIFAVSAELAIAIVELRREAEAGGVTEGVLISAWLDRVHPDWRQNLPLAVNDAGARQLVDGLIGVERLKGGAGGIRARRFLLAQGCVWREQIELHLDGDLISADPSRGFKALAQDWSRLRLFASDEAAQYISGELAVVEPSQDGRWTCMASRPSLRFDVPAHVPLTAELRGEGVRVMAPFLLPGGEAGGRELRVCTAEDVAPDGSPTRLEVIGYGSGGYRAEPIYLDAPATWVSLATLNQFVARTPSRIELWAELLDANRRPVPQANARWTIDEELPMSVIADDLAVMLRSSGRLDARVRLDFNDSQDHHWYVSEFAHELDNDPRGLTPRPAVSDPLARIVGRPFADAARETDFGPYGELEQLNPRPIDLNPGPGAWLIYLRANDRVLSRPRVVNGSEAPRMQPTALGRAMLSDPSERSALLTALVDRALADPGHEDSREIIRSIAKLAVSLNGLPPSTFDVFRLLETFPLLGPMMLYGAAANEIEPILRLADNLKMAWCLVPQSYWKEAWEVWGEHFSATFPDNLGDVAKLMTGKRAALLHHEPSLAPLLGMSGSSEPIAVIANSFLNRSGDRIRTDVSNPFRPRFEALLPNWPFGRQFWRAADAPILAARIARGEMTEPLGDDELTAIKDIARAHPRYFTAAFAAQFGAL